MLRYALLCAAAGFLQAQSMPEGLLGCAGDPSCPNCDAGQCVVSSGGFAVDPTLGQQRCFKDSPVFYSQAAAAMRLFDSHVTENFRRLVGPVGEVTRLLAARWREFPRTADVSCFDMFTHGGCGLVSVKIPAGGRLAKVALWRWNPASGAYDQASSGDIGQSSLKPPAWWDSKAGTVAAAWFENLARDRKQAAAIHVVYTPEKWESRYDVINTDGRIGALQGQWNAPKK